MVFFGAFFLHAFVDPALKFGRPSFNGEAWGTLTLFNILAYLALFAGYTVTPGLKPSPREALNPRRPKDLFGRTSFWLAALLSVGLLLVQFVGASRLGLFSMPKGFYGYYVPSGVDLLNNLFFPLYIFVPAVFLAAYNDRYAGSDLYRRTGIFILILVLLYSLARFSRQMIFGPLLTTMIIVHFRIFKLHRSRAWLGVTLLLAAAVLSGTLLSRMGEGVLLVSRSDVLYLVQTGQWTVREVLYSLGTILPGQEVLANVIGVSSHHGTFGGATYFETLINKLTFGFIERGSLAPSQWYINALGLSAEGHGFDFAMTAEAFMNFGFAGFLVFIPIGLLLGFLSKTVRKTSSPVVLVWAAFMIVDLVISLRTDSVGFVTRALYFIWPLIFFRIFFSVMLARPSYAGIAEQGPQTA